MNNPYDPHSEDEVSYSERGQTNHNYSSSGLTADEEAEDEALLQKGLLDWRGLNWRSLLKVKYIPYYIILVVICVLVGLMTIYHKQIIAWMQPVALKIKAITAGWLIPVAILFVISFPPLFGHEIVAILCGVVWGLWVGFGIVAFGTFIGEIGNFYAFKHCFRGHAEKLEKKNVRYACLAYVVREGGFLIALLARLSAIPGHFTTVVFSTAGMNIWIFALAAALSLPKQLITVYLGVVLDQTNQDTKSKIISDVVLAISFIITVLAAWYIWHRMTLAFPMVLKERRRLEKLKMGNNSYNMFPVASESMDSLFGVAEDNGIRMSQNAAYKPDYDISYNRDSIIGSVYNVDTRNSTPSGPNHTQYHNPFQQQAEFSSVNKVAPAPYESFQPPIAESNSYETAAYTAPHNPMPQFSKINTGAIPPHHQYAMDEAAFTPTRGQTPTQQNPGSFAFPPSQRPLSQIPPDVPRIQLRDG